MDSIADSHEYCTGGYKPDDIVISGVAGRFPACENVGELKDALYTKKNLIIHSDARYEKGACGLPFSSRGLISDLDKLDADFFCISYPAANNLDPASRKILEVSYEAIVDSGYDPYDLRGKNIGVYTASINDDAHQLSLTNRSAEVNTFLRCMIPNRTSYALDFTGPSYVIDTACSSSGTAFYYAVRDIRENRVDAAIVNSCQIDLDPRIVAAYMKLGVSSKTGNNIPFDKNSDGFIRSEAVTALFLQKAEVARRSYASVLGTNICASGYIPEGISVPSFPMEIQITKDTLRDSGLMPEDVDFIEAHGTGTAVGDPIELNAVSTAFCVEKRNKALYIGSIKSNIGHPEASSGTCGMIKALIACETNIFPPNYRFSTPNPACQALVDGQLRVVTEPMTLTSPYIPINSFGFGGALVQTIVKQNPIQYNEDRPVRKLPVLVLYPGTTEAAIECVFEFIKEKGYLPEEFFALLNKISFTPTSLKPYRGYHLFNTQKEDATKIKNCSPDKRPVWFILTGMGCQWPGMGLRLMEIDVFAESMKKCAEVLKPLGIDLFEILKPESKGLLIERHITPAFVAITSIQVSLVDTLRLLDIHPDGMIGHSTGEMVCCYADGCLSLEQTILAAYWRGQCVETANLPPGAMAAVGLSWEETQKRCPEGVYAACDNARDSVTISGLKENVESFVEQLIKENVFARNVNAYGYSFHSKYTQPAMHSLREALSKVITNPLIRSKRFISTSYSESEWDDCKESGAEYLAHNLGSPVLFKDALKKIPENSIIIEIGPHFLLQSILKRELGSKSSYMGLVKRNEENAVDFFFESLGKLYNEGANPRIERLYPPIKFPVPRGTPMISDLIRWNHSQSFYVPKWAPTSEEFQYEFNLEKKDSYLMDHKIDGRSLFPATGYVYLAWEALANKLQKKIESVPLLLKNFKIHRATIIHQENTVKFYVNLLGGSGNFEISEGSALVASGQVQQWKKVEFSEPVPCCVYGKENVVDGSEIYSELKMSGYEYGPAFRSLAEINMEGTEGVVLWQERWITFLDSLLLFFGMIENTGDFSLPTGALSFKIDPAEFETYLDGETTKLIPVTFNPCTQICRSVGVEIVNLNMDPVPRRGKDTKPTLEKYKFVPYVYKYFPEKEFRVHLSQYLYASNYFVDKIGKSIDVVVDTFKFESGTSNSFKMSDYTEKLTEEHTLLKILKEIADNPDILKKKRIELFSMYIHNIENSSLNSILTNESALRILIEIISENSFRKLNVLEVMSENKIPLLPKMISIMKKYSYIKFKNAVLLTSKSFEVNEDIMKEFEIQHYTSDKTKQLSEEKNQDIAVAKFMGGSREKLTELIVYLKSVIKENGFLLLFCKEQVTPPEKLLITLCNENLKVQSNETLRKFFETFNLIILCELYDSLGGRVYLLRLPVLRSPVVSYQVLKITEKDTFHWVENVKSLLSNNQLEKLWLIVENNPISGIVGMVKCLKQEPGGERIRCVFIMDKKKTFPDFNFEDKIFKELLGKDLLFNVWMNGCWGAFRHINLEESSDLLKKVEHSYMNCRKYGDLSSFTWLESPIKYSSNVETGTLVHIYYSALNFKDVMLATGKLSLATTKSGNDCVEDSVLGIEFSGRDTKGHRLAGLIRGRGIATSVLADPLFVLDVPDKWSLEEAATVPVVYATCYYALMVRGKLRRGESILIHSGTGGVGIAAIRIALALKCTVYATVGNDEKKRYLSKTFPQIPTENIGCSRNTTFEKMIKSQTRRKGVDVVLNSLSDEKFEASIRCLAKHGRFLEIGKYDLSQDKKLGLKIFLQNISFHGIFLDQLFEDTPEAMCAFGMTMELLREGILDGVVKPLDRTVFKRKETEEAFRYMAKGVHVGKVLIKVREEEPTRLAKPKLLSLQAVPKTYFYASKVYIVVGGLGGFGIELIKWIFRRGGKNVILTTRFGARTPYHSLCLLRWQKAGFNVQVSTLNVAEPTEAEQLVKEALNIGPVGGIFNSAVVLKDAFLDCQNPKSFEDVCAPKAKATINLDQISRKYCPELDYFVCFSSVSCGRGNAGQSNYGYANSVMERICEERKRNGMHGLAIQWGIIGEVGVVHRHMGEDANIAGVSAQNVESCLEALDYFCQNKDPVVSSYVNALFTKKSNQTDVLTQIAKILGMNDSSEINTSRTFGEMGIDSMVGVELKQVLDSSLDVTLTMQEIFDMKVEDVKTLVEKTDNQKPANASTPFIVSTSSVQLPTSFIQSEPLIALNSVAEGEPVFIVDLGDNCSFQFKRLGDQISQPVFALVWTDKTPYSDMKSLISWYMRIIERKTKGQFHLVGYSIGGSLCLELAFQSERKKKLKSLTLLDCTTHLRNILSKEYQTDDDLDVSNLCGFIEQFAPNDTVKVRNELTKVATLDQKIKIVLNFLLRTSNSSMENNVVAGAISVHLMKMKLLQSNSLTGKLIGNLTLLESPTSLLANDVAEVKRLFIRICSGKIDIHRTFSLTDLSTEESLQRLLAVLETSFYNSIK